MVLIHLLKSAQEIEFLNVSDNNLGQLSQNNTHIVSDVLSKKTKLTHLLLGSNNMHSFDIKIRNMFKLSYLDLSNNFIKCFNKYTIRELNTIQKKNNISIDLNCNKLSCSCGCIHFIKWMVDTNTRFVNAEKYVCYMNGIEKGLTNKTVRQMILDDLLSMCYPLLWMKAMLGLSISGIMFITVISLLYRFRYELLYLWLKLNARVRHSVLSEDAYKYDAFVCYCQENYLWIRHELLEHVEYQCPENNIKLCFHHRDFLPGAAIVDNIIDALEASRYAIIVISQDSVKSEWWQFEFNMAHQMSLERKHNMMICVFLETIDSQNIPVSVRRIVKMFTCLKWPQSKSAKSVFWEKLKDSLKKK